jgi:hypothetical protein
LYLLASGLAKDPTLAPLAETVITIPLKETPLPTAGERGKRDRKEKEGEITTEKCGKRQREDRPVRTN